MPGHKKHKKLKSEETILCFCGLLLHPFDKGRRRSALNERQRNHCAARGFDFLAPMDLVQLIVASFYEHVRQQFRDQAPRRNVVEDDDVIHVPERREYLRALGLIEDRTVGTFQLTHASIAVYCDDQRVTKRSRLRQITHVPDVQQIENAVRKNQSHAC